MYFETRGLYQKAVYQNGVHPTHARQEYLMIRHLALYPNVRFIPHRQFCSPKLAHLNCKCYCSNLKCGNIPNQGLIMYRGQHIPNSFNHSLYPMQLQQFSYPDGTVGRNQLLDGSISFVSVQVH